MRRGEVWSAATGAGFGGKPRPVLVVQSDAYRTAPNIIVALFTSAVAHARDIRPRVEPDDLNGLEEPSLVMVDVLVTVPRRKFGRAIGRLSDDDMARVEQKLLTMLGFAG